MKETMAIEIEEIGIGTLTDQEMMDKVDEDHGHGHGHVRHDAKTIEMITGVVNVVRNTMTSGMRATKDAGWMPDELGLLLLYY